MIVSTNSSVPLTLVAPDGETNLFGQAKIYDGSGLLAATVNLNHVSDAIYTGVWPAPATDGFHTAVFRFFTDAGRTTPSIHGRGVETIDVSSFKTQIARILGLVWENTHVDQQVYDGDGHLTGARIRSYDTAANALAGGATGLKYQWAYSATWTSNVLTKYTITVVT